MLNIFSKNQPLILGLVPIILIFNVFCVLFLGNVPNNSNETTNLLAYAFNFPLWLNLTLNALILFANAVFIAFIFNKYDFWEKNTYLPSFFYVVVNLIFSQETGFIEDLIAQSFIILIVYQLFKLNQQQDARRIAFDIGFLLGIAAICNPVYLALFPALFVCIRQIRPFVLREYFLIIIGTIVPFLYVLMFAYNTAITFSFNPIEKFDGINGWLFLAFISLSGLYLLLGFAGLIQKSKTSSIRFKKLRNISIFLLLCQSVFVALLVLFGKSFDYFSSVIVFSCMIMSYSYLSLTAKPITNILSIVLLLLAFAKFFI